MASSQAISSPEVSAAPYWTPLF